MSAPVLPAAAWADLLGEQLAAVTAQRDSYRELLQRAIALLRDERQAHAQTTARYTDLLAHVRARRGSARAA